MENVMLDLETLGQSPGCVILSIGAIAFDAEHGTGRHFYQVVNTRSCQERYGLKVDPNTVRWWDRQTPEARLVLQEAADSKMGLLTALQAFHDFCDNFNRNNLRIWGNGSDFDNAILAHCYKAVGMDLPWKYWNGRCFRTLRELAKAPKKAGSVVKHNALEDATDQAVEAVALMKKLRG